MRRSRPVNIAVTASALVILGVVLTAVTREEPDPVAEPVRIAVGSEQESVLLANVIDGLLDAAGIPTEIVPFGQARDARQAVALGEADLAPSYTGAVWLDELGWADPPGDPATSYGRVQAADARRSLVWVAASEANATFAFVVPGPPAAGASLGTLEDLALTVNTDPSARLCVDPDVAERPDGLPALARLYSISDEVLARQVVQVAAQEAVAGVVRGICVAGLTTATDGQAWLAGLRPLQDPFGSFPAFVVGVVAHEDRVEPAVEEALAPFGALTTDVLASWNGRAGRGDDLEAIGRDAATWLRERAPAPESSPA